MPYAAKRDDEWHEISPGEQVVFDSVASSYLTMLTWSEREKAARGIYPITEPEVPAGKFVVGSSLTDHRNRPLRVWQLEDAPILPVTIVSKAQAKLALLEAGLLDGVETALSAMEGTDGQRARIEWNDRTEFHRDHQFIGMLAAAIGLSDAQVDALFERAAQL